MQTWAKRGVQAALVTGGMLAAGGVASASETCPDRPAPPLGEWALTPAEAAGDGTPSRSGLCFSGELFPEGIGSVPGEGTGRHAKTTMAGTIDPVRDLLPAVENAVTRELPRITDDTADPRGAADTGRHRSPEDRTGAVRRSAPMELAGWVADSVRPDSAVDSIGNRTPVVGHPNAALDLLPRDTPRGRHAVHQLSGSPAEGFHRSLSWSGPIGGIVDGMRAEAGELLAGPDHADPAPPLVRPSGDPAVVEGIEQVEGLLALWEGAIGRSDAELPAAVLAPQGVDLTSPGELGGELRTVPDSVLDAALSATAPPRQVAPQEFVPLRVPGEHQEQANEVPKLTDATLLRSSHTPAVSPVDGRDGEQGTGIDAPLPVLGDLHALDGGNTTLPDVGRISDALAGNRFGLDTAAPVAQQPTPAFSTTPNLTAATVHVVDELAAAVPEREQVARNPFREMSSARAAAPAGGMALPVLDGGIPDITAVQGETIPLPALDADGTPVLTALDTAAMLRSVSRQL